MFCASCGKQIHDRAVVCVNCGLQIRPSGTTEDSALKMVLPIGRSVHAIIAGYLALFSFLFPVGFLALIFGVLALRDIDQNPEKTGKGRAWFGIVIGILNTVGWMILLFNVVIS